MPETKFTFKDRGFSSLPQKLKKPSKMSCGLVIFLLISSLIFGFLGGTAAIYSLSKNGSLSNTKLGLDLGTKNYKVTEESAITTAVEKVTPSVVSITAVTNIQDIFGRTGTQESSGSGFVVTSDGYIMTNKHVASNSSADYTVFTSDGKAHKAQVKAQDPLNDIAILKINATNLKPVELGDSDELKVGQIVIAIGNALGFQNSVTSGIISAKERTIEAADTSGSSAERLEGLLQTDAAINQGNSGGPLVNVASQVIGMNTAVAEKGVTEGIGFAIPINVAKSALESFKKAGKIVRPFIGIRYILLTDEIAKQNNLSVNEGAYVYSGQAGQPAVVVGSPADRVGIKAGDIITAINGDKIDENHSLSRLIQQYQPQDTIEVSYLRNNSEHKAKLKLAEYKN